jgi:hypothetical protein
MKTICFYVPLCLIGLNLLTCSFFDPDPYGCYSRGALVIPDENMKNGNLNQYYNEFITESHGWGLVNVIDSTLPPGLEAIDSFGVYIRGTPNQIGNYKILIKVHENGTQCAGRQGEFKANLEIQ